MTSILLTIDSSTLDTTETQDLTVDYVAPIILGRSEEVVGWEVALIKANLWYSWYNISVAKNNNTLEYFNGTISQLVTIPDGQYTIDQLNDFLHSVMDDNGDFTIGGGGEHIYDIILEPNFSTLRVTLTLTNGYELDLSTGNLYLLLGAEQINYTTSGDFPMVANINDDINSIVIHCSLVNGFASYRNKDRSDIIFTFVPESIPGTNIDVNPVQKIYLPVNVTNNLITEIRMRITDNLNRPIDLNGEPVTYLLHLQKIGRRYE